MVDISPAFTDNDNNGHDIISNPVALTVVFLHGRPQ